MDCFLSKQKKETNLPNDKISCFNTLDNLNLFGIQSKNLEYRIQ